MGNKCCDLCFLNLCLVLGMPGPMISLRTWATPSLWLFWGYYQIPSPSGLLLHCSKRTWKLFWGIAAFGGKAAWRGEGPAWTGPGEVCLSFSLSLSLSLSLSFSLSSIQSVKWGEISKGPEAQRPRAPPQPCSSEPCEASLGWRRRSTRAWLRTTLAACSPQKSFLKGPLWCRIMLFSYRTAIQWYLGLWGRPKALQTLVMTICLV